VQQKKVGTINDRRKDLILEKGGRESGRIREGHVGKGNWRMKRRSKEKETIAETKNEEPDPLDIKKDRSACVCSNGKKKKLLCGREREEGRSDRLCHAKTKTAERKGGKRDRPIFMSLAKKTQPKGASRETTPSVPKKGGSSGK